LPAYNYFQRVFLTLGVGARAGARLVPVIRHTVAFRLRHPAGSAEEAAFLADAMCLRDIPGVEHFERLRQVNDKNDLEFGLSMEFADRAAYDFYSNHPVHTAFVAGRWVPEVEAFQETDYQPL
jgi:hypothetical protein